MRVALDVPFRDVAAADLRVAVAPGAVAPRALGLLELRCGPFVLELRVLGASHAVVARCAGVALSEVVSCAAPGGVPLAAAPPRSVHAPLRHLFTATVEQGTLAAHAARLEALAGGDGALVASFPGAPEALTALRALPAGRDAAAWESWHLYPRTGEVVRTEGRVELA